MDVFDVRMTDEDGFLSRSTMIKAKNTIMKERILINRVASEIVFQPLIQTPAYSQAFSKLQKTSASCIDWKRRADNSG